MIADVTSIPVLGANATPKDVAARVQGMVMDVMLKAVAEGRVIESGVKGGYGNTVVVQAEDGRKMLYAHNNQNFVQVGDWVSRGEEIAGVGSTGRATGPHVHFEVKF